MNLKNRIRIWWNYKILRKERALYGTGLKRDKALRSVGPGWANIINDLYDAKPKDVHVIQVKEKFGGLRFYVGGAPRWYHELIDAYSHYSETVCEVCGEKGKLREDLSWILTLCDKHYDENNNRYKQLELPMEEK